MSTSKTSSILLTTQALCKTFQHEGQSIEVLRDLNFSMHEQEKVAVVGSSGAGKSTLLHLLGALDHPTSGEIYFQGQNLADYSERQLATFRNEKIGFIFQFHHLLKELNALENVMMPSLIARTPRKKALNQAKHWLDEVGLSHRLTHRPSELSGGEQQRVSLARALMNHPLLLLADEPTGNLDQETSQEIHDLLTRVNEEYNTALLIVTHNSELAQLMPRQVRMRNGHLVDQSE
jgi:lipoprotein-releasing system ATP-binding protein